MVWYWRRYLGKWGALIAGLLMVISPYMLYYGRYVRNESFVGFSGVVMLYAMLRHLEVGGKKYLFLLAGALALHFTAKETSFIYTAQALIYLAIYFIAQVTRRPGKMRKKIIAPLSLRSASPFCSRAWLLDMDFTRATQQHFRELKQPCQATPGATASPLAPPEAASVSPTLIIALAALIALVFAAVFLDSRIHMGTYSQRTFI